jgi:hypothetical protein
MSAHSCLRCKTVTLVELEPGHPDVTFFEREGERGGVW